MSDCVEYLIPNGLPAEYLAASPPLDVFSEGACEFVAAFSDALIRQVESRQFPELTALAFWFRKSGIVALKQLFDASSKNSLLKPRGTVLHFAPANVDTMFAYSWLLSLLCGNRNIVRLSSRRTQQSDILIRTIGDLLGQPEYDFIRSRNTLVRYTASDDITVKLSGICDVRVIWGGDETVKQLRAIPIPPAASDVAFANKQSLAVINASSFGTRSEAEISSWAEGFCRDAYSFDQLACSSPRQVVWVGTPDEASVAMELFWSKVEDWVATKNIRFGDIDYINKLALADSLCISGAVTQKLSRNNNVTRLWATSPCLIMDHCGCGLFMETRIDQLQEILSATKYGVQTISYAGFTREQMMALVRDSMPEGIDRVVPFGRALEFSHVWDGYDLLRTFTRAISIS